jgi:tRNA G37 N-methylase Trm5
VSVVLIIIIKTVPKKCVLGINHACRAVENVRFSHLGGSVLGDSKELTNLLQGRRRILMPLKASVSHAVSGLKKTGGWIHYYDFQHASSSEDPRKKTEQKVAQKLDNLGTPYMFACSRIIRSTGPNWYQTVLDIQVGASSSKS